jgi:hypothetical protein
VIPQPPSCTIVSSKLTKSHRSLRERATHDDPHLRLRHDHGADLRILVRSHPTAHPFHHGWLLDRLYWLHRRTCDPPPAPPWRDLLFPLPSRGWLVLPVHLPGLLDRQQLGPKLQARGRNGLVDLDGKQNPFLPALTCFSSWWTRLRPLLCRISRETKLIEGIFPGQLRRHCRQQHLPRGSGAQVPHGLRHRIRYLRRRSAYGICLAKGLPTGEC